MGVGYALAVTRWPLGLPTVCAFKLMTGRPCPTCGMTHACCALVHGEWWRALQYHVAVVPLAMVVVAVTGVLLMEVVTGRPLLGKLWEKTWRVVLAVTVAAVTAGWVTNWMNAG